MNVGSTLNRDPTMGGKKERKREGREREREKEEEKRRAEGEREREEMIMIAFITINSGLVPLIEGLRAQILDLRFEIIDGLRPHLLLCFSFSE